MDRLLATGLPGPLLAAAILLLSLWSWRRSASRGRLVKLPMRIASIALGTAASVALVGAGVHAGRAWRDADRFRPPGRLVQVNGRQVHVHCLGPKTGPTAVIVPGWGGPSPMYEGVLSRIGKTRRACLYDRPGYAWSAAGAFPRTLDRQVSDLRNALRAAGETAPVILVAHSYGGLIARSYAATHPDLVTGMVLADTSVEFDIYWMASGSNLPDTVRENRWYAFLAPLGYGNYVAATSDPVGKMFDGAFAPMKRAIYATQTAKQFATKASEFALFAKGANEVFLNNYGAMPLVVLAAEQPLPPNLDPTKPPERAQMTSDELSRLGQRRLARLSTRSRYVGVADSDHLVPQRRPDLVNAAIDWVASQGRAATGSR